MTKTVLITGCLVGLRHGDRRHASSTSGWNVHRHDAHGRAPGVFCDRVGPAAAWCALDVTDADSIAKPSRSESKRSAPSTYW